MNKLILLTIATGLIMTDAVAKPIIISASTEEGLYTRVICPSIVRALYNKGVSARCQTSSGSGENFEQVAGGMVTAGLMQKDVLYGLATDASDHNYIPLGSLTPEAIWMVALSTSKITFSTFTKDYSEDSKPKRPLVIGVAGDAKSGSYLTMTETIIKNIPSLKHNVDAGYVKLSSLNKIPPNVAYHQLGSRLDAVMFVQMPDLSNPRIQDVLNAKGKYTFLDISSPELTQLRFANQPVYREVDIQLEGGLNDSRLSNVWNVLIGTTPSTEKKTSVHTLVTETTLLINPETIDGTLMSVLSNIANSKQLLPDNSVAGSVSKWWQTLKKASGELTK
jgi:TRAP-type uncharacterized transport system substrate-binding protein